MHLISILDPLDYFIVIPVVDEMVLVGNMVLINLSKKVTRLELAEMIGKEQVKGIHWSVM